MHNSTRRNLCQCMLIVYLKSKVNSNWGDLWRYVDMGASNRITSPFFRITAVLYMYAESMIYCVRASRSPSPNLALCILISSTGLSLLSVLTASSLWTVFIPLDTLPNIVCLPSKNGVGACLSAHPSRYCQTWGRTQVMKNCEPVH
jgi:hypothetical protein